MQFIANILAAIHNAWAQLPRWAQTGIRDAVAAAIGAILALNLVLPANIDQAKAEAFTAFVAAAAAAWAIIRVEILPPLLDWIFTQLGFFQTSTGEALLWRR